MVVGGRKVGAPCPEECVREHVAVVHQRLRFFSRKTIQMRPNTLNAPEHVNRRTRIASHEFSIRISAARGNAIEVAPKSHQ